MQNIGYISVCSLVLFFVVLMTASRSSSFCCVGQLSSFNITVSTPFNPVGGPAQQALHCVQSALAYKLANAKKKKSRIATEIDICLQKSVKKEEIISYSGIVVDFMGQVCYDKIVWM